MPDAGTQPALLEPSAVSGRSVATSPLLVVLHGHGSSPAEAAGFAERIDPGRELHHVTPVGTVAVPGGLAWFDEHPASLRSAATTVAALLAGLAEDQRAPVVAVGYSQGAAALLAALLFPDVPPCRAAAVVCVSGFLPDAAEWEWQLDRLAGVPVLVQHGRADTVVPSFLSADLATLLGAAGASVTFDESDASHTPTDEMVATIRSWLGRVTAAEPTR